MKNKFISPNAKISPTAIIKEGAIIDDGTIISDFCYIGENVKIGKNNFIGTSVHIKGNTTIGDNNQILDNCIIGLSGKHIGYHFYQGKVIIGNNNFINNNCSIDMGNTFIKNEKNPQFEKYAMKDLNNDDSLSDATIIGDRCYILNNVTIHHNCQVGLGNAIQNSKDEYDTIICTGCCLNGFVHIQKGADLGSGTFVRELCCIGYGSFTAMSSHIVKDVKPFTGVIKNQGKEGKSRLVNKFSVSQKDIENLQKDFLETLSGKNKVY